MKHRNGKTVNSLEKPITEKDIISDVNNNLYDIVTAINELTNELKSVKEELENIRQHM